MRLIADKTNPEEWIDNLKDRPIEIIQTEVHRKNIEKTHQTLKDLGTILSNCNWGSRRRRENGAGNIFEEMHKIVSKFY